MVFGTSFLVCNVVMDVVDRQPHPLHADPGCAAKMPLLGSFGRQCGKDIEEVLSHETKNVIWIMHLDVVLHKMRSLGYTLNLRSSLQYGIVELQQAAQATFS
jgi:hypothetical protein